jgi:hypothetical protein
MESNWLTEDSQFLLIGQIYPEWTLRKSLLGLVERDQAGHYFISNEALGVYAVGFTREEALEDFKQTLIHNYQYLEAKAEEEPELAGLLREYQKYLKRSDSLAV